MHAIQQGRIARNLALGHTCSNNHLSWLAAAQGGVVEGPPHTAQCPYVEL